MYGLPCMMRKDCDILVFFYTQLISLTKMIIPANRWRTWQPQILLLLGAHEQKRLVSDIDVAWSTRTEKTCTLEGEVIGNICRDRMVLYERPTKRRKCKHPFIYFNNEKGFSLF
ncbi:hypothetical protein KP509_05G022900 [Ceratopteris richardii]|uniref:Uncharacterized protein n=1 Tax=Ceratopteris richardii TaxID=49495 RepID=A0A8T2UM49_CERRI|nr:hypothetical protein KP509_05G022900 [Ceratopteris richardii]